MEETEHGHQLIRLHLQQDQIQAYKHSKQPLDVASDVSCDSFYFQLRRRRKNFRIRTGRSVKSAVRIRE